MAEKPSTPIPSVIVGRRAALSSLAVTALVLAAIPCCPLVNLLGVSLGIAALKRIDRSNGAVGGKRTATAAVVVGLILSVTLAGAWLWFTIRYEDRMNQGMYTSAVGFIAAAAAGDTPQAQQFWTSEQSLRLDDSAIADFGEQIVDRYGKLDRISVLSTANSGSLFAPRIDAACVFVFESSKRTGSAGFRLSPSRSDIWPMVRLLQIRIDDAERGDLLLGSAAETH